jgi:uncharacterized protein with HEPN domain
MIQIIGEAASRLGNECRDAIDLPWPQIVGMRNFVAHGYFDLDEAIIWRTAVEDVPMLASAIDTFLDREESEELS